MALFGKKKKDEDNAFTEHAKKYSPGRADVCYRGLNELFGLDGSRPALWR